jgi:glutathione S-transferase
MRGTDPDPALMQSLTKLQKISLDKIAKQWLNPKRGFKFMFGDEPSICDLSLACELTQLHAVGKESMLKENYPSIHHWFYVNMMSIPAFK